MSSDPNDAVRALVRDRLAMVKRLIEHNEQIGPLDELRDRHDADGRLRGWTHPVGQHDALVSYLLLTCFDVLGQPKDRMDFNKWLTSKATKAERDAVKCGKNAIQTAKNAHETYLAKYGATRGFRRFVTGGLSPTASRSLLDTIRITDFSEWPGHGPRHGIEVTSDDEKVDFLYRTRNIFTHKAQADGSLWRAAGRHLVAINSRGYQFGFNHVRTEGSVEYQTSGWPFTLFKIVAEHIQEPLPDFDVAFDVIFPGMNGPISAHLEGVPWKVLRDPEFARICGFDHGAFLLSDVPSNAEPRYGSFPQSDDEYRDWSSNISAFIARAKQRDGPTVNISPPWIPDAIRRKLDELRVLLKRAPR